MASIEDRGHDSSTLVRLEVRERLVNARAIFCPEFHKFQRRLDAVFLSNINTHSSNFFHIRP